MFQSIRGKNHYILYENTRNNMVAIYHVTTTYTHITLPHFRRIVSIDDINIHEKGVKKRSFFEIFGVLCILVTSRFCLYLCILVRFALLP